MIGIPGDRIEIRGTQIFVNNQPLPERHVREIRRGDIIVFKYPGNKYDDSGDSEPNNIPYKTNYVKL